MRYPFLYGPKDGWVIDIPDLCGPVVCFPIARNADDPWYPGIVRYYDEVYYRKVKILKYVKMCARLVEQTVFIPGNMSLEEMDPYRHLDL